jgi:hypothetical protein
MVDVVRLLDVKKIVSMAGVTLPVAGRVTNFNPLIAEGYAGKTGSDSAAGGCLAFFTRVTVGARELTAAGVVMGQGEGSDTSVILATAGEAAERLVDSVVSVNRMRTIAPPVAAGGRGRDADSYRPPSSATGSRSTTRVAFGILQ